MKHHLKPSISHNVKWQWSINWNPAFHTMLNGREMLSETDKKQIRQKHALLQIDTETPHTHYCRTDWNTHYFLSVCSAVVCVFQSETDIHEYRNTHSILQSRQTEAHHCRQTYRNTRYCRQTYRNTHYCRQTYRNTHYCRQTCTRLQIDRNAHYCTEKDPPLQRQKHTLLQTDRNTHYCSQTETHTTAVRHKHMLLQTDRNTHYYINTPTQWNTHCCRQTETHTTAQTHPHSEICTAADRLKHTLLHKHTHTVKYALLQTEGTETRTTADKTKINPAHSTHKQSETQEWKQRGGAAGRCRQTHRVSPGDGHLQVEQHHLGTDAGGAVGGKRRVAQHGPCQAEANQWGRPESPKTRCTEMLN